MEDSEILRRIGELVEQEHTLRAGPGADGLDAAEAERLQRLETTLDQCWDLLRQRRALRSAGGDPDDAHARPPEVVERYVG